MRIGIALGGGGAKGLAHIGVLQALEDAGIACDVVAGTSIGSLVGAAYAAGRLEKLADLARTVKLKDIPLLLSPAFSTSGFFSAKNALALLHDCVEVENIEDLSKPFAAVAVDLNTEEAAVFMRGNLHQAIRASMAIPVLFTPVLHEGHVLIDGGTLEPVPVRFARELGADFVIAVDLFGKTEAEAPLEAKGKPFALTGALSYLSSIAAKLPLPDRSVQSAKEKQRMRNIVSIVESTAAMHQRQLTKARLREYPADLLIQPAVTNIGLLDFHKADTVIDLGRSSAREVIERFRLSRVNTR